ncbi:HEAT repeat domain-containing protein, partial [Actinomadura adrarensis]
PRAREPLPELTRHRDGSVRQSAVNGLHGEIHAGNPEALAAVIERTRDEESGVRHAACMALRFAPMRSGSSDALAACLSDEDEKVRVTAAAHLALRDDPRGDDVLDALGYPDEDSPYYWLIYEVSRHQRLISQAPHGRL